MITNLLVTITAYCSCTICCGSKATGLCADGHKPQQGITVAASRHFHLGSHLTINGVTNTFTIQDHLAKQFDGRVDVYFQSHKDALKWGKQTNWITIYDK